MSLYSVFTKAAVTGGALLLLAGCTGRKDVAISAKDNTIRQQQEIIVQKQADYDKAQDLNKQLSDQNTQLAERNAKATMEMNAKVMETNAKVSDLEQLVKELKLSKTEVNNVYQSGDGGIHITVAGTTLFPPGRAELLSSAHSTLLKVAHTLKARYPNNYLRIEGHTDSTPIVHSKERYKDNMALSIARAHSVYEFLAREGGISRGKMYTAGYGASQPLVHPERTAADRAKNRRVEIVIMPTNVKIEKTQLARK